MINVIGNLYSNKNYTHFYTDARYQFCPNKLCKPIVVDKNNTLSQIDVLIQTISILVVITTKETEVHTFNMSKQKEMNLLNRFIKVLKNYSKKTCRHTKLAYGKNWKCQI